MRNLFITFTALAVLLMTPMVANAQTAATVTGEVTDASGAALPDTDVALTNPTTGTELKVKTNSAGTYRFGEVPPGPHYIMTFSHPGFASYSIKDVYVNVANSRTQNAKLTAGTSETIEVSASGEGVTINTEDASIGNNFQVDQMNDLPVANRNSPAALINLQPGVANSSVTGARTDQTNITLDGLDVNDFATGSFGAVTGNAPVDSVQEFRGTVAGFQTSSGQGGGGQFQFVTKSGTNHFHGNLNEYHRDNSTTANSWFNKNSIPLVRQPKLVRNQFGGALGGPILHDKLFFFVDVNESRIAQQANVSRTVPLPSFVAGNITYVTAAAGCGGARKNDPTFSASCFGTLTPAQVKALDPAGIGQSAAVLAILKSYPTPNDLTLGDGINTGGYRFTADNGDNLSNYVGKIDYTLTPKIKISGRGSLSRENRIQSVQQFPGLPPAGQFIDRSYAYVANIDWQISQNKFNRLGYGSNVQDYSFPRAGNPLGVNQISFASGTTTLMSTPYSSPVNGQGRHIPIPQVSDDFIWSLGRHNLNFGGLFKWINTSSFTNLDLLSQTIGLGGNVQGFTSALHPADLGTSVSGDVVNFDEAFAVDLGRVGSTGGTYNYDKAGNALPLNSGSKRNYRYYQTMAYAGDSWKVKPNLTLNYGLNWQIYSVPWETNGLENVQTTSFNDYLKARVAQTQSANFAPNGVPFITYLLGGPANNGPGYYSMSWKDLAPRVSFAYQPSWDRKTTFNGGAAIVYDKTIVNAIQYQQDQYSYLFGQNVLTNYGDGTNPDADLSKPAAAGPYRFDAPPSVSAPATPKAPYTPYVTAGVPNGLINGQFNEMVSPDLKTPYNITTSFGMQHEFPNSIIFKVAYAGRLGRRLLAQADASQLLNNADPASGQTLDQAFTYIEQQVRADSSRAHLLNLAPQPYFEHLYAPYTKGASAANITSRMAINQASLVAKGDLADFIQAYSSRAVGANLSMSSQFAGNSVYTNMGFSSYHGLLVTVTQNLKHGLKYDVNYTFQHSIDNTSLIANNPAIGGYGFICDAVRPRLCRGNSDFDVTHVINSDYLYALPIGRGRMFGSNMPLWLNEIIGGWETSGIIQWQTGSAFGTSTEAFIAGYANNAPAIRTGTSAATIVKLTKSAGGSLFEYANPSAAAGAYSAPTGFTIGSRNDLRGPRNFNWDASLKKSFALWPDKGIDLKLAADAFNVLNHPSFAAPGNNSTSDDITTPTSFGQLTTTTNGARVVQLVVRLEF